RCRHRHWRRRSQVEGTGAGRRGRLDRACQHASVATGRRKTQGEKMSAFIGNRLSRTARAWRRGFPAAFVALCALGLASFSLAQGTNSIDGVTVSRGSSGRIVVRFQLKNPPANPPASFSIQSPPRIALDFLDTANGLGATQRAIDEAALRSLNVIQAGNRT